MLKLIQAPKLVKDPNNQEPQNYLDFGQTPPPAI